MFIDGQIGVRQCIKSFDLCVPIGTEVEHNGVTKRTWSHAGLGMRHTPVVFLDDNGPPVPLSELKIHGVEQVSQRRKSGESTGKGHGKVHAEYSPLF